MSLMCAIIINSDNCCPGEGRHHEYKDGGQFKAILNQANNRQVDRLWLWASINYHCDNQINASFQNIKGKKKKTMVTIVIYHWATANALAN